MTGTLPRFLLLGLVLIVAGAAGSCLFSFREFSAEPVSFRGGNGDIVEASFFTPQKSISPEHTVISLHSIFQDEHLLASMTRSLLRGGYKVMIIKFKGYSGTLKRHKSFEDYCSDTKAAIRFLRERGDRGAISLMGHSIGANLACTVAMQSEGREITSVVALGFPVDAGLRSPSNVLFAVGILDELHPVREMRDVLKSSTGDSAAEISKLYGRFEDGSARRLFVAPLSDHYLEVFDPFFFAEAGRWMSLSAGGEEPPRRLPYDTLAMLFYSLFLAGTIITTGAALTALYRRLSRQAGSSRKALTGSRRLLALSAFGLAGLLALAGAFTAQHFWKDSAFTVALCVVAINGTALWHGDSFPDDRAMLRILGRIALYGAAVWLSVCVGIFINRADFLLSSPGYLPWAFLTALFSIPTGLFVFISKNRFIIMQILPYGALPLALAAVEILIPGRIGCAIAQVISHLFLSIKKIDLQIKMKSSPASLIAMLICIGAAVVVWRQILGEGYDFSAPAVTGLATLVAKLVFIPLLLIFLTVRSRAFSRLEGRLAAPSVPDVSTPSSAHSDIREA